MQNTPHTTSARVWGTWGEARYPRPSSYDEEAARAAFMRLQLLVGNAGERTARGVIHGAVALALLARRTQSGDRALLTVAYLRNGAGLGRPAASRAIQLLRSTLGGRESDRGSHGWLDLTPEGLEGCWRLLEWVDAEGLLHDPMVTPAQTEEVGKGRLGRRPGTFHCPCGAHHNGDRRASGIWDEETGLGTCMVSRETFRVVLEGDSLSVRRFVRVSSGGVIKNAPRMGSADPQDHEHRREEQTVEARQDLGTGLAGGTLRGEYGIQVRPSGSRSLPDLLRWHSRRWGGDSAERDAWEELARRERGERAGEVMGERLIGVGHWVKRWDGWLSTARGKVPQWRAEERGTGRVLFDLDGLEWVASNPRRDLIRAWEKIISGSHLFSGISSVVRTSSSGLQVLADLEIFQLDVRGFYRRGEVRQELDRVGGALLDAARRVLGCSGGVVDRSAWAPGRLARLPGWRVKSGSPEMATLWACA